MQGLKLTTTRWAARVASLGFVAACWVPFSIQAEPYGIGQPLTAEELAGWDITVYPDGKNLPEGSATVMAGRKVFEMQCAVCHGAKGEGGIGDRLVGGAGTLATDSPIKTIGSYWPYATTLFDYTRRAMPLTAPQTLTNEEVYAVTGYMLYLNDLLPEDATIDAETLVNVKMPNRDGFFLDPRPDVGTQNKK